MNQKELATRLHKRTSVVGALLAQGMPADVEGALAWMAAKDGTKVGRSLADFRAQYDKAFIVPRKVRDALHALGGGWEYEVDFAKRAGVSLQDLGRFRETFADHIVTIGRDSRRAWAGTAATAKQMRAML